LNLTPFENDLEILKIGKATANLIDFLHWMLLNTLINWFHS
jgi:hypothetical protein